jgi:hypothetical protein
MAVQQVVWVIEVRTLSYQMSWEDSPSSGEEPSSQLRVRHDSRLSLCLKLKRRLHLRAPFMCEPFVPQVLLFYLPHQLYTNPPRLLSTLSISCSHRRALIRRNWKTRFAVKQRKQRERIKPKTKFLGTSFTITQYQHAVANEGRA